MKNQDKENSYLFGLKAEYRPFNKRYTPKSVAT